jgi:hypothetical protein
MGIIAVAVMVPGKAYNDFGHELRDLPSISVLDVCLNQYLQGDKISVSESWLDEEIYRWLEMSEIYAQDERVISIYIQHRIAVSSVGPIVQTHSFRTVRIYHLLVARPSPLPEPTYRVVEFCCASTFTDDKHCLK